MNPDYTLSFYTGEGHAASGEPPIAFNEFVAKLAKPLSEAEHLSHMALGVAGEAGELIDAVKKHVIYEKPLDVANVIEELGDLAFYMQGIMNPLGITWAQVVQVNYEKLAKRYNKLEFSTEAAVARVDKNGSEAKAVGPAIGSLQQGEQGEQL